MDRAGLPVARPGQCIGLLGGSFDPPHAGHVHITLEALKRLGLDRVWWLVSPGNPLKTEGPAPLARRMAAARAVMRHPRVVVTDVEARMGTRFTAETLERLQAFYPGVRFVWLMGADNLATFDRWQRWRWIMDHVAVCVIARPGQSLPDRRPSAATVYAAAQIRGRDARRLCRATPPAWCFLTVPMVDISSTEIRERGDWRR